VNGHRRLFETRVVPENQNDHARQDHEAREAIKAARKGARNVLDPADEERTDKAAEIARRQQRRSTLPWEAARNWAELRRCSRPRW
jgi:hypothetical protein